MTHKYFVPKFTIAILFIFGFRNLNFLLILTANYIRTRFCSAFAIFPTVVMFHHVLKNIKTQRKSKAALTNETELFL